MKKIKYIFLIAVAITCVSLYSAVHADPGSGGTSITFDNPIKADSIQCLISDILKIVANLGAVVAVFFIIYSGFLFITAQGDTSKVTEARRTFLYTIIGTTILLGAWGISMIISTTIGHITNKNYTFTGCPGE